MIIILGHISISTSMHLENPLNWGEENIATSGITEIGGNAALQAIAAARTGAKTSLCGTIGNDVLGKTLLETLRREGVNTTSIAKHDSAKTGYIASFTEQDSSTTTIATAEANQHTHSKQLPDTSFNQRTLLLLQTDLPHEININVLKRARAQGSKSILSITNSDNLTDELINLTDLVIEKEIQNKKGYNCFCGTLAACLQAGMDQETSERYAQKAGTIASENGGGYNALPYLSDIENKL